MSPRDFAELSERRVERARELAERYPESREVLSLYAEIASFQEGMLPEAADRAALIAFRDPLIELVRRAGPALLAEAAGRFDESSIEAYLHEVDVASPASFFARVLLQPYAATSADLEPIATGRDRCPRCGHLPQVALLRPKGDGAELSLSCSLCLDEWTFPRGRCIGCDARKELAFHSAPELGHIRVQTCDACRTYLHSIDLERDLDAIADVDELAALPLDLWAREQGYEKRRPNLAGV